MRRRAGSVGATWLLAVACGDGPGGLTAAGLTAVTPTISSLSGDALQAATAGDSGDAGASGPPGPTMCEGDEQCPADEHCGAASKQCVGAGQCALAADCPLGQICPEGHCMPGDPCAQPELERTPAPARVLVLLHRGASMAEPLAGDAIGRWDVAKAALSQLALAAAKQGGLGLGVFSACLPGQACAPGGISVPIAPDNAAAVQGFLADKIGAPSPEGATMEGMGVRFLCGSGAPENAVGRTLQALLGEDSLQAEGAAAAVIVITDAPEDDAACTVDGAVTGPIVADVMRRQPVPVRSFAVGLPGAPPGQMDGLAEAGGSGRARAVAAAAELAPALLEIHAEVTQCGFVLAAPLDEGKALQVFLDDEPTPLVHEPRDGFQFDVATGLVWLAGDACARLRAGSDLDLRGGCPKPAIGT